MAMFPPPPGLFSMMKLWPSSFAISSPMKRATSVELPPGAKGTTRRMGFAGYVCAFAPAMKRRRSRNLMSEPVEPCRVVDQDLLAERGIRRPHRKLVEQPGVVDLGEGPHIKLAVTRHRLRVRMRPVGAPDDAI